MVAHHRYELSIFTSIDIPRQTCQNRKLAQAIYVAHKPFPITKHKFQSLSISHFYVKNQMTVGNVSELHVGQVHIELNANAFVSLGYNFLLHITMIQDRFTTK